MLRNHTLVACVLDYGYMYLLGFFTYKFKLLGLMVQHGIGAGFVCYCIPCAWPLCLGFGFGWVIALIYLGFIFIKLEHGGIVLGYGHIYLLGLSTY